MGAAWLLTLLAIAGVLMGVLLGRPRVLSIYVAAAGGGLLFGISLFWLVPEIAALSGWIPAIGMTAAACLLLALADRMFLHSEHASSRLTLGPILAATAIHSFLDGWSVRVLESLRIAGVAAPLGLALHKIPEGVAIGWIAHKALHSPWKAALAAAGVETITLLGGYLEPHANRSGLALFGSWWTSAVVAIISGSFLFLGIHAVLPNRRRVAVLLVFAATTLLIAGVGILRAGSV